MTVLIYMYWVWNWLSIFSYNYIGTCTCIQYVNYNIWYLILIQWVSVIYLCGIELWFSTSFTCFVGVCLLCRSEMDRSGRRWSVVSAASSGYTTGYTDSPQSLSVSNSHIHAHNHIHAHVHTCPLCSTWFFFFIDISIYWTDTSGKWSTHEYS